MIDLSKPLYTDTYPELCLFSPSPNSAYLFSNSEEERSTLPIEWVNKNNTINYIAINDRGTCLEFDSNDSKAIVSLRATRALTAFLNSLEEENIFLDITGMEYRVWAPVLKSALAANKNVFGVYSEPKSYTLSDVPTDGTIFDLSAKIEGVHPLPGFINFRDPDEDKICFIPFLGFEGARFAHVLEVDQPGPNIIPVIGVPGYQPEYPFHSYLGNKNVLMLNQIWKEVQYVDAHCPFSVLYLLESLRNDFPDHFFKLAPIGSKPHGLGAILYAILHSENTEIVYDNPIRKGGRTKGQSRVHVYDISSALTSYYA